MTDAISSQLFDSEQPDEEVGDLFGDEQKAPQNVFKEDRYSPPTKLRSSGEKLLGTAIFSIGSVLVSRRIDPPVGRCLQLESPLAGKQIDEAIAGTFIDRLLQPLFRKSDDIEGLGAVLGLPILVGIYERRPEMAPVLEPMLYEVVGTMMEQVAPLMKKDAAKKRRTARSLADLNEAFNIPPGEKDPVAAVLGGYIFQDYVQEGEENAGGNEP